MSITIKDLTAIADGIAPAISRAIKEATVPLAARVKALEDQKSVIRAHTPGQVCPAGSLVMHEGAVWVARYTTARPPAAGEAAWTRLGGGEQEGQPL